MIHLKDKTVANIVTDNVNTAKVFHKYQIDFGFHGDIVLRKVCKRKKLNLSKIVLELNAVDKNKFYLKDYNNWNINLLISFLTDVHHHHKQDDILLLKNLAFQIHKKYHNVILYANDLIHIVLSVSDDILIKMNYEETIIYPHIRKLNIANKHRKNPNNFHPILVDNISTIEKQRIIISEKFKAIASITNNYDLPKDVCKTFKLFYAKLKKFQIYLQEHNHLEKNILLPKALELEQSLICNC